MKTNSFVITRNVREIFKVAEKLQRVEAGVPGMGLVHGFKGLGKTTGAIYYASQEENRAIYTRAKRGWTDSWMLEEILIELSVAPRRGDKAKFDDLVSALMESPRLIIIDETNLVNAQRLETMRAIHDLTANPILFIGHEGILKELMRYGPFFDRILYQTELKPLTFADMETYCAEALEIGISSEALEKVMQETKGNFRKGVIRLKELEDKAKVKNLKRIEVSELSREAA